MSIDFTYFTRPIIVKAFEAERLTAAIGEIRLLADSQSMGGTASTVSVRLKKGAPGALPHRHDQSAEMFYVLEGAVRILCGEEIVLGTKGDFIVVPPGMAHAFSADSNSDAELLIIITPGVERFDYFRKLMEVVNGKQSPESLNAVQTTFDTHFIKSPIWNHSNSGSTTKKLK